MSDEKMTAIERLEALLDEKDAEIRELESEKADRDYGERWGWMRQKKSDEAEGLPVPRLEIRWRKLNDWERLAEYSLVYRFFLGEVIRIPISMTKQSGGPVVHGAMVETPFRDGAHIRHDMRQLNLPGYAICDGLVTKLEPMDRPNPYDSPAPTPSAATEKP